MTDGLTNYVYLKHWEEKNEFSDRYYDHFNFYQHSDWIQWTFLLNLDLKLMALINLINEFNAGQEWCRSAHASLFGPSIR